MRKFDRVILAGVLAIALPHMPSALAQAPDSATGLPIYTEGQTELLARVDDAREQFLQAYEAGNAAAIMETFRADATFAGTLQPFWLDGEAAISDLWTRYFEAWSNVSLKFHQPIVRFYGDNIAVETGYMLMLMANEQQQVATDIRYSITRVSDDGGETWSIANMNVSRLPPPR